MKRILLLGLVALVFASCSSAKYGCPGSNFSGERYKASKFKWG